MDAGKPFTVSASLAPGTTFAGYRVESTIGRGGMGVVYRATDLSLQRPVALKLIAPEFAEDEQFRRRFLRESRLAASLDHPNVVPIFEAGEDGGVLYLAMRYVEGSDLRTVLRRDLPPAPERLLAILAQVAGALDAAHRRGLVHRDVKPGNVLLDEDGHAYLTDFGVTKQLGGDSTESGQLVGTLDYLAPEQIRGESVDARADVYALACVLYQCLAGAPPFHRSTEAETLWAHMQDEPPALPAHPALTPVLARGLAKDRDDRHASCGELIEAARAALAGTRVPHRLVRRRHAILAAGLLVLAATAAAVVTLARDDGPSLPVGNGLVAIAAAGEGIDAFTEADAAPSNVAVGEGAVWVLNAEDEKVTRIDPETKGAVETFAAGDRPTGLAAGAGALWIGNGGGDDFNATISVSRVDPATGEVTATAKLPRPGGWPSMGLPEIAVASGAVWVANASGAVFRIDAATGRLDASVDAPNSRTIAAGAAGIWTGGFENAVRRIDPRTNRVAQTIRVGSHSLSGIAVGAGSVWATSEEGRLWRIEPGPDPITLTIDVGIGASFVAFGDGAVWTANLIDGMVSRIDPRTNAVTARIPIGSAHALAAGGGSAWVSVAGATPDRALPASSCGGTASGGRKPDVLIASDLALQGPLGADQRAMADAIDFVLADHGFRAGRYVVGYQSCDDSTAQAGLFDDRRCAANAHAFARAERLVAVIGPDRSFCAQMQIPVLNRAAGGPLALVSPATIFSSLTRGGPLVLPAPYGRSGEPEVYYPTRERNFFRVIARQDLQGVAFAMLAKRRGLKGVYLIHDAPGGIGKVVWADPFRRAAARLGVRVTGSARYAEGGSDASLADRVARSGADGVLIGTVGDGGLIKALRARLGARATIMAGDGFAYLPDWLEDAGRAARDVYVSGESVLPGGPDSTPAAERFTRDFGDTANGLWALHAAQATEVVLQAIARSDGTRASVLEQLRRTAVKDGFLGSFGFDRNGDMTPAKLSILRVTGRSAPGVGMPSRYEGAVVDRVVTIPATLAG